MKCVSISLAWCAFIASCTLAFAQSARAYTRVGDGWPQPGGDGSPITLTYSYENMFNDGMLMPGGEPLPKLLIRDSIEEALGLWASVAPLHFVEVADDGISYPLARQYGVIRFRHIYINGPDPPPPALPIAKAQAYYPGGTRSAGDVEYDHGDRWQEVGTLPQPDILGATVHELGHALGLGHSASEAANMYWIFNRSSGLGTAFLDQDDIDGIHAVYGEGIGSVTPLIGSWPDRAIPPTSAHRRNYEFTGVPSSRWVEAPLGPEICLVANSGTLVSSIAGFPTGFEDPFTVSVGGAVVGQFTAGQSVNFQSFPGGGVSEFVISGINPLEDDLLGFPLKLVYATPAGSVALSAVPEPAAHVLLILAILALSGSRPVHPRLGETRLL